MLDPLPDKVRLGGVNPLEKLTEYFVAVVNIIIARGLTQPKQIISFSKLLGLLLSHLPLDFDGDGCGTGVVGPTRVGARHHSTALVLEATDVHAHQVCVVLLMEVGVGQTLRTRKLVATLFPLILMDALLGMRLLIFCDARLQTSCPQVRFTVDMRLISNILLEIWLFLLLYHGDSLSIHIIWLDGLAAFAKGTLATRRWSLIESSLLPTTISAHRRIRPLITSLLEHLFILCDHITLPRLKRRLRLRRSRIL